jgi:diguanylate cyclase (GGDEF)-like protein/PAS domain S-box-containing protein
MAIMKMEEVFPLLFDALPDIVCFKDADGRWLKANHACTSLFGLDSEECLGKDRTELAGQRSELLSLLEDFERNDSLVLLNRKMVREETRIRSAAGEEKAFDLLRIPLLRNNGIAQGLMVMGRDITLLQQARDSLFVAHRQQLVIDTLLRLGLSDLSLKTLLEQALDVISTIPWLPVKPKGGIFLVDEQEAGQLLLFAQKDLDPEVMVMCRRVPLGQCLCGICAERREPVFRSHVTGDHDRTHQGMVDHGHYVLPIVTGGRLLGVLNLYTMAGHRESQAEEKFLVSVCRTLATIIEKKRSERRLLESEASLRKSQRIARLGYWEWDLATDRISWSEEVYDIFGLDPAAHPRIDYNFFLGLIHPDDRFSAHVAVDEALNQMKAYQSEYRLQRPDGAIRMVREEGEVTRDDKGESVRVLVIIQDITERKQSEVQLDLAARIFDNSIEGITITDPLGTIQKVNPAFTTITGYSAEEALGKNPRLLKSDRHDQEFYRQMWGTLRSEGFWQGEIWNRRKNGEIYPEWLTITSVRDPLGQVTNYVAVFHDMSDVRQVEEQLRFKSNYDALTGLPNRALLLERLESALSQNRRHMQTVALLAIDIDNFKHINECLGHNLGDLLLLEAAKRCRELLRQDITIARLGGDDFYIILEEQKEESRAAQLAEELIASLSRSFMVGPHQLFITVSIGITFAPADGDSPESLIRNAETAMYQAKEQGKNRYRLFTRSMNDRVTRRLQLNNSLRHALEREEFQIYYQPKVQSDRGVIKGMEALVRWNRPGTGLVDPAEFIPMAEENGLIVPIGEWILATACRQAQQWRADGHDLSLAVNISPRQFGQQNLLASIEAMLAATGLPPEALQLEITEGVVLDNEKAALTLLGGLRNLGVKIALDDFGTGYSSLHYLRQLPIDTLKIDRSFIRDLPADKDGLAITTAILAMAKSLNLEVVAEGVETEAHFAFLRQKECDYCQGYYFSPPLPPEEFTLLLEKNDGFDLPWRRFPLLSPRSQAQRDASQ